MKRTTKILLVLGAVIVLASIGLFLLLNAVLMEHGKHDQVISGTKEIYFAVYEYSERNGHAPSDLASLVPDFIPSIPTFPSGARLDYHVSQSGKEWTVDVVWIRKNGPLVFRRTNAQLSPEDVARQVGSENGCYILKTR